VNRHVSNSISRRSRPTQRRRHGHGGTYLSFRRPGTRGFVSIAFLVVALIAGGLTASHRITTLFAEPATVEVAPRDPGISAEVVANQFLESASQLAEGVRHSVDGLTPLSTIDEAWVTHYGKSFNGQALGCDGRPYASNDGSIVAVGPALDAEWPCGTILHICGPGGCIVAEREDGCPGCGAYHVDLSEEGLLLVCGPGSGVCKARVGAFAPACHVATARNSSASQSTPLQLFATLAEVALGDRTAGLLDLDNDEVRTGVCSVQSAPSSPAFDLPQMP
jgi:hypothetical protein